MTGRMISGVRSRSPARRPPRRPAISAGFTLTKTYYTLDGKTLDPSHLRQNDRFIISLTGQANDDGDHRAVLVDMLPAGWEIETPISATTAPTTPSSARSPRRG